MEKNTVLLSTEEYNRLRDFEKDIKANKTIFISGSQYVSTKIITTDESVIELVKTHNSELKANKETIEALRKTNDEVSANNNKLLSGNYNKYLIERDQWISKMTIFEFLKIRSKARLQPKN